MIKNYLTRFLLVTWLSLIFIQAPAQKKTITITDTVSFTLVNDTLSNVYWGTAVKGTKIDYVFKLKNNSGDSLIILKITTGDGGCYAEDRNGRAISSVGVANEGEFIFHITQSTAGKIGQIVHPITIHYKDAEGVIYTRTFRFYGKVL